MCPLSATSVEGKENPVEYKQNINTEHQSQNLHPKSYI